MGNGSTELISAGIQAVHPKDAVVLGPAYSEYERELSLVGSRMHYYDLKASEDFHLDVEDLEKFITEDIFSHGSATPNSFAASVRHCRSVSSAARVAG